MRVKFLIPFDGPKVNYQEVKAGDVLDVPDAIGQYLLMREVAELAPKQAPEPTKAARKNKDVDFAATS